MLTRLLVENFKSFDSPTGMDMVASSRIRVKPDHRIRVSPNLGLLKYAVIYGANASGKSNLIDFIVFFRNTVERGLAPESARYFCRTGKGNSDRDSLFELQLELDGRFYAYGFSARLFENRITGEWLHELHEDGSTDCIFEKDFEKDAHCDRTVLFLGSNCRTGSNNAGMDCSNVPEKVYRWITEKLEVVSPDSDFSGFRNFSSGNGSSPLSLIAGIIRTLDTGITDIRIEKTESGAPEIKLVHGGSAFDFGFEDESDGTRRLFDLLDVLLKKTDDMVFVVDELERSLHPDLTERFLDLFARRHEGQKVQLIFTTHDSTIMDRNLFRRDEIWFAEKNADNSSRLYSLDRFNDRYDRRLGKAYLEGRYGAVPVFSNLDFDMED